MRWSNHSRDFTLLHAVLSCWWFLHRYILFCWYIKSVILACCMMYATVQCKKLRISWLDMKEKAVDSAAGFSSISTNHVMTECVEVLNGYHMEITTPPKKEVHNVKSYFSGHYRTYGINIQVVCDHNCHFLFIGVGWPGIMGDREAVKESGFSGEVARFALLHWGLCIYPNRTLNTNIWCR